MRVCVLADAGLAGLTANSKPNQHKHSHQNPVSQQKGEDHIMGLEKTKMHISNGNVEKGGWGGVVGGDGGGGGGVWWELGFEGVNTGRCANHNNAL